MKQNFDLAIIGAGPAGMQAATQASELGLATVLLDEQPSPGGQIYRGIDKSPLTDTRVLGPDYYHGESLSQAMRNSAVEYMDNTVVWDLNEQGEIGIQREGSTSLLSAQRIIIAIGAMERPFPIPGWTLPGVMSGASAQILLKTSGLAAEGAVFAGTGPLLYLIVSQLIEAGVKVKAVLDTTPFNNYVNALRYLPGALGAPEYLRKGLGMIARIRRSGVTVMSGVTDIEVRGKDKAEAIKFRKGNFRKGEKWQTIATDQIFLHQGVVPNVSLAMSVGCEHTWNEQQLCWQAVTDEWGTSSIDRIAIVGDAAAIAGAKAAEPSGRLAVLETAFRLGKISQQERDKLSLKLRKKLQHELRVRPFLDTLYKPQRQHRIPVQANAIVCRCEEITVANIDEALKQGCSGPNQLKAFTRCGMGPCQGRMCGLTVSELIADRRSIPVNSVGSYRVRSPVKPITLGEMANFSAGETA